MTITKLYFKGHNSKTGVQYELNLNDFDLVPDQGQCGSNFFLEPLRRLSTPTRICKNNPLGLDISQLPMNKRPMWMKGLSDFTVDKRNASYKSESVDSTPKLGKKNMFTRTSTKSSLNIDDTKNRSSNSLIENQSHLLEIDESEISMIEEKEESNSLGYISGQSIEDRHFVQSPRHWFNFVRFA